MTTTAEVSAYLDALLSVASIPDYPNALNGLQLENSGSVTRVAAAVDYSLETVKRAVESHSDFLILHHGMFWAGLKPLTGALHMKLKLLLDNDIAVYSSHIPLDFHPTFGNNVLLSQELELKPNGEFAQFKGIAIGLSGESELPTAEILQRAKTFAQRHGGDAIAAGRSLENAITRKWAMCTGAGASSETIAEAKTAGIDTLIVGEGPHHTAVEASDLGMSVIYAGHYATETLGVRALAKHLSERFGLEYTMIDAPTGL
jgi:dinuclear metal center YbgI/SA1388 family protein